MTTIVVHNLDYLTLVVAGSVMIALAQPDVPGNRGATAVLLAGAFVFIVGLLRALQGALGFL